MTSRPVQPEAPRSGTLSRMDKVTETVEAVAGKVRDVAGNVLGEDGPPPLPPPPLPDSREQLLALHDVARRKRDAAPLGSHERIAATFEIERIEIQIARVERSMDPPLV